MVSFEALRTFEMILAVSLTRFISKRMSKDSLVEKWTMLIMREIRGGKETPLDWNEDHYLREYTSALRKK